MSARMRCRIGAVGLATGAVVLTLTGAATAADGGHGFGRMGPSTARTTAVNPATGADFEMPFVCGQRWTGSTRSGHSPSSYTIDWNTNDDLGRPALASAPGVVTKAVTLTGSYGRYVVVDHGGGYTSLYAHLNAIATTVGAFVDQGELIGYVGTSGNSTGPHLHFEERLNGAYFPPYLHRATFKMGSTATSPNCTDKPVSGDWNGDGRSDLGIFRATPTTGEFHELTGSATTVQTWGEPGDVAVTGDWDADGRADTGVRPLGSRAFLLRSATGAVRTNFNYGLPTDNPLIGDWDGNRYADLGVYRPSTRQFILRPPGGGTNTVIVWGAPGDKPVSGDWDQDGRTDIGTFTSSNGYWTLRVPSGTGFTTSRFKYGVPGDLPVTGDWNGDKITDVGVWRPSTATYHLRKPTVNARTFATAQTVYGNKR
jgi:hypothetical protein